MSITEQRGSMTDASGPVGAQLAKAREGLGWSIDDVCRRTNIRPAVIEALERDDIRPSGGVVYARGHVRSIAQALHLDPVPLVAAFDAAHGSPVSVAPVLKPDSDAAEVSLRTNGTPTTGPRWPLVMAAILAVVIAIAAIQLLVPGKGSSKKAADAAPSGAVKHSAAPRAPAQKPLPSLVFPVPAQGVTLRVLLPTKPAWLDVTDERGAQVIQTTVQPSRSALDLHANGMLRATIGDASAALVSCNGHPLGPLGAAGQVVTLVLTRGSAQCPAS